MLDASGNQFFSQLEPIIEAALFTRIHSLRSTEAWRRGLVLDAIRAGNSELTIGATRSLLALARTQKPATETTRVDGDGAGST